MNNPTTPEPTPGVLRIGAERQRQIDEEGWTADHDDEHDEGEMVWAAVCYAAPRAVYRCSGFEEDPHSRGGNQIRFCDPWPWSRGWDKRTKHAPNRTQRIRELEKAGALIAAEIDRLLRLQAENGDDEAE